MQLRYCDVCGQPIKDGELSKLEATKYTTRVSGILFNKNMITHNNTVCFDLCDLCTKDFVKWIGRKGLEL